MTPFFILLYVIYSYFPSSVTLVEYKKNILHQCDSQQANYDMNNTLGSWFEVALIPGTKFPRIENIACFKMDISEIDEDDRRYFISRLFESPTQELIDRIKSTTIIRQLYHYSYHLEKKFATWSKVTPGVNGCYIQLSPWQTIDTRIADAEALGTSMQLHILETSDGSGPYLLQVLSGSPKSAIIYRRSEGVSLDRLEPILNFLTSIRGDQRPPRICVMPTREITVPPFQRP